MSDDPFLDALNAQASLAPTRMTSEQLAAIAAGIPGARVTSGQRDPAHNAAVGGVPNSQHIAGTALDMVAPGMTLDDVKAKFPGEQVLYHDAGSGLHYHIQGAPEAPPPPTAAPVAPVPQPQARDPYLAAFDSATGAGAPRTPDDNGQGSPARSGGPVPVLVGGDNVGAPQQAESSWGDTFKSAGRGLAAITPLTDSLVNGRNYIDSLRDDATGFANGVAQIPATALHMGGYVVGASGAKKVADALHRWGDSTGGYFSTLAADPNSAAHRWGNIGGEVGATLPLSELTIAADAARAVKAGKFVSGLARYSDLAAQGGLAGLATSGGHDMLKSAAEGAVLAPVVGAVGDALIPPALKVGGAVSEKAKALAERLMGSGAESAPAVEQTIRKAADLPIGDIEITHTGTPFPEKPKTPLVPKSVTPEEMRAALGSRGSNSGLEANPNLSPEVAAHVDQLRMQGVPLDQALREAEVTAVGGNPTIATTTRNPEDQAAVWEGAKQATPEGRALSAQIAQNNAAVVNRVQNIVQDAGGVPAQGEAAETAAASLAKASDAERAKVSELYTKAASKNGDATVDARPLNDVFQTPEAKAPVTAEGRSFVQGMRRQIAAITDNGTKPLAAADLERLRQTANDAYDPTAAKEVNRLVGQFKDAIDGRFDEIGKASNAYKAARAAHRAWADAYDNPDGIAGLIKRDAQGNFVNGDNWRKAENFIGSTGDKPFIQIVNQLKANGDTQALNRLKASVIQRAYERGTNNATDKLGNSTLNGKMFFNELNKIGSAKLEALFSPGELSDLATTGRAAIHLNEAVPGTNNTSNTSSALAKALLQSSDKGGKGRLAARLTAHGLAAVKAPIIGNIATEAVDRGVTALGKRAHAKELARALTESMSPAKARAVQAVKAKRLAEALGRKSTARQITKRAALTAATLQGQR